MTSVFSTELIKKLEQWSSFFHSIHVLFTNTTERLPEPPLKFNFHQKEWEHDFSEARNYLFSFLETDWIVWIDDDDFIPSETLTFIQKLQGQPLYFHPSSFCTSYIYTKEDSQEEDFIVLRTNILKRSAFIKWEYPVFETIKFVNDEDLIIRKDIKFIHQISAGHREKSRSRDNSIMESFVKKHPDDPHMQFYLANNFLQQGKLKEAKNIYTCLMGQEVARGHYHYICSNLAWLHFEDQEIESAGRLIDYMANIGLEKNSRDFYILALSYYQKREFDKAKMVAEDALLAFTLGNNIPLNLRNKFGKLLPYKLLLKIAMETNNQTDFQKYQSYLAEHLKHELK